MSEQRTAGTAFNELLTRLIDRYGEQTVLAMADAVAKSLAEPAKPEPKPEVKTDGH